MSSTEQLSDTVTISATNIGGIDETTVSLEAGVNVLTGHNATNRTSFLQAIMAAVGSNRTSLKGDANNGHVELTFGNDHYERHLQRQNGTIEFDGNPYLDDSELADLFAFLLESNEARRSVGQDSNLRELLMRPIDTDEIEQEISDLEAEKREVDERLQELDQLENKLPSLEKQRTSINQEIQQVEAEFEEIQTSLDERDLDVEKSKDRQAELEETFSELQSARRELENLEYDLETEREARQELEREHEEIITELESAEAAKEESLDQLEGRIHELRERKQSLGQTLNELQSVIRFNEERLEEGGLDIDPDSESDSPETDSITDQLVEDNTDIVCWTCGSTVDQDQITSTIDQLQSLHHEKLQERNEIKAKIETLSKQRKEIQDRKRRLEKLKSRHNQIADELATCETRIEALEATREETVAQITELEAEVESFEDPDYNAVLETHREANQLELELEKLQEEREDILSRIEDLEEALADRESLQERRESITEELTALRTKVNRIETNAIESFNSHMESLLSILEYANIDRIWIERRETTVQDGRRNVDQTTFDLHVIRSTDDGRTYEDTINHLSESEREVTGLVFALAGYLVHDVYDRVPFMLLDSLEAIDSNRIADLVEYFEDYVDCLVVALLPEDANALSSQYNVVSEI